MLAAVYSRLGAPSAKQLRVAALREGLQVSPKDAQDFVNRQQDAQVFRKKVQSDGVTATRGPTTDLQIDLVDLKQFAGSSKVILFAVNPFDRKLWMEALPNKTPATVTAGFRRLLGRMEQPEVVSSDQGQEFGGVFNAMLEEKGILHRYKRGVNSTAVLDRAMQTVKTTLFKKMTSKNTLKWDGMISDVEKGYNESLHGALLGSPDDAQGTGKVAKIEQFQLLK